MKTKSLLTPSLMAALFLSNSSFALPEKHEGPITVSIMNAKNEKIGTVILSEVLRGVKMEIDVAKLTPGKHGIHIHEKGECKAPDFKSAGEHYNPSGQAHGFDQGSGPHGGDLANLIVGKDGKAHVEMVNQNLTLDTGSSSMIKTGGTAIVIHAKADDDKTQPSGNSGDRIACGVVKRP